MGKVIKREFLAKIGLHGLIEGYRESRDAVDAQIGVEIRKCGFSLIFGNPS